MATTFETVSFDDNENVVLNLEKINRNLNALKETSDNFVIPEISKTDAINVTSSTILATATAVKTAYDLAAANQTSIGDIDTALDTILGV